MIVNISYIKLKKNVTDSYTSTKRGWVNKDVEWSKLKNVLSNSKIQFSPYSFRNGYKTSFNWSNDKQNMLVFDIDEGMSIAQCQKVFKSYRYLIGTTKSHQKDKKGEVCDRYRLCLPAINIPTDKDIYFRTLSLLVPSNDSQTETGTGAFLGNDDAIIIYNDGKLLDCHKASILATKQLEDEKVERLIIDEDMLSNEYSGVNTIEVIKEQLTMEIVVDVLESIGYEVRGNKFKLREDERTDSATINYKTLTITDYGSGYFNDIFGVIVDHTDKSLSEAIRYVKGFI